MNRLVVSFAVLSSMVASSGCTAPSRAYPVVYRPERAPDGAHSAQLGTATSRLIARCLQSDWSARLARRMRRPATVKVLLRNNGIARLEALALRSELERTLAEHAQVALLAGHQDVRYEQRDQALHASDATLVQPARRSGADALAILRFTGDAGCGSAMVTLEVVDVRTSEKLFGAAAHLPSRCSA